MYTVLIMEQVQLSQDKSPDKPQVEVSNRPVTEREREAAAAERINNVLREFAQVLDGLEDYAVFSSTAMYLHGQRLGDRIPGEAWAVPPGDLDINFFTEKSWRMAGERLRQAGAVIDKDGEPLFPGQEIRVISGTLNGYPFEFFLKTARIVVEQFNERTVKLQGLRVLALEDVQRQYQNNLEFDSRLWREVQRVVAALEAAQRSPVDFEQMCEHLEVTPAEARQAITLWDAYQLTPNDQVRAELEKQLSSLIGGVKTKTAQRRKNLQQLLGR
jgi:hypothetical protein